MSMMSTTHSAMFVSFFWYLVFVFFFLFFFFWPKVSALNLVVHFANISLYMCMYISFHLMKWFSTIFPFDRFSKCIEFAIVHVRNSGLNAPFIYFPIFYWAIVSEKLICWKMLNHFVHIFNVMELNFGLRINSAFLLVVVFLLSFFLLVTQKD